MPKSTTLTRPSRPIRTLPGLHVAVDDPAWRGRPRAPGPTPAAIRAAWRGGSAPLRRRIVARSSPSTSSMTMNGPRRVLAVVVDGDDVRVAERRGRLRLLAEARREVGVAQVLGAEQLEGDVAAEPGVGRRGRWSPSRPDPAARSGDSDHPGSARSPPSGHAPRSVASAGRPRSGGIVPHGRPAAGPFRDRPARSAMHRRRTIAPHRGHGSELEALQVGPELRPEVGAVRGPARPTPSASPSSCRRRSACPRTRSRRPPAPPSAPRSRRSAGSRRRRRAGSARACRRSWASARSGR